MAFPAQTKNGNIVQIVEKIGVGAVEVFTDKDGGKYTRDLVSNFAPHILIPIEDSLDLAENMVAAGTEGAAAILDRVKKVADELGIGAEADEPIAEADSLVEKIGGAIEDGLHAIEGAVESVSEALGIGDGQAEAQAELPTPEPTIEATQIDETQGTLGEGDPQPSDEGTANGEAAGTAELLPEPTEETASAGEDTATAAA